MPINEEKKKARHARAQAAARERKAMQGVTPYTGDIRQTDRDTIRNIMNQSARGVLPKPIPGVRYILVGIPDRDDCQAAIEKHAGILLTDKAVR